MKLIVGLGNPEKKYDNTRHNVGFMVMDHYSKSNKITFKEDKKLNGFIYKSKDYILLKPTTFMNNSGLAIRSTIDYYKIDIDDILVFVDDFNIPFSSLRLRKEGSSGGHNGLKSIIAHLGTESFKRARIGLGDINNNAIDFVLSEFSKEELKTLENLFSNTDNIIDEFIKGSSFDIIMNKFNESKN